jgi:NAD+ synthase (glutamine-hydrolysing)
MKDGHSAVLHSYRDMKNYGFIRVAAATMTTRVANPSHNAGEAMTRLIGKARQEGVSIIVFPELSVSGYSCGDLFGQRMLLDRCEEEIARLAEVSYEKNMAIIAGVPVPFNGRLYNCAAVIKDGEVKGLVPKTYLSSHGEYCQGRWFASGSDLIHGPEIIYAGFNCIISPNQIFEVGNTTFAVEIGEDIESPIPPSSYHALAGAQIIAHLSAGNETVLSQIRKDRLMESLSSASTSAYISASACGDSSQDTVFTGNSSIWENGSKLAACSDDDGAESMAVADIDTERLDTLRRKSTIFTNISPDGTPASAYDLLYNRIYLGDASETDFSARLGRYIERYPFAPQAELDQRCCKILDLQTKALMTRLKRIGSKAVIGISGGLDSTLALIVTTLAFDRLKKSGDDRWKRENIIAVTMPGFGTTSRTKNNAWDLMEALGVTCREISIVPACRQHFEDIGHDSSIHDATYENTQARERTQILMDIANQTGGIVVGTGDLSELALGWATYNGDHMSMYGINADIPKTLVRSLVKWAAENRFEGMVSADGRSVKDILLDIVDTPISPELLPASESGDIKQITEDLVGPYELHDFFLYNFVRYGYSPEKIFFLAQKAFQTGVNDGSASYDDETISKWLKTFIRRFFSQQFKRSCMPDGPKIGSVGLSPRGDWHMASDAWAEDFL